MCIRDRSYTTFMYSNLKINPEVTGIFGEVKVSLDVENTGKRAGRETVQLYVRDRHASVTVPVKELKGFEKISLAPGEKKTVEFRLTMMTWLCITGTWSLLPNPEYSRSWLAAPQPISD